MMTGRTEKFFHHRGEDEKKDLGGLSLKFHHVRVEGKKDSHHRGKDEKKVCGGMSLSFRHARDDAKKVSYHRGNGAKKFRESVLEISSCP